MNVLLFDLGPLLEAHFFLQDGLTLRTEYVYNAQATKPSAAGWLPQRRLHVNLRTRKQRLSLVIPERAMERLNWLQGRTDAASHTEVIRQALFVYEQLVERVSDGSRLMEKTAKGELLPLPISIDVKQPRVVSSNGELLAAG